MRSNLALAACVMAGVLLSAPDARANGRIPVGRYLVGGPGAAANVMALQATFGVLVSVDTGRTWRWSCEEALGFAGVWDPPLAITADGTVHAGLLDGLTQSRGDYCAFARPATDPMREVIDLAVDPGGTRVVAALDPLGMPQGVAISDDRGATWRVGWTQSNFFIQTVDIAPGRPDVIYASGYLDSGAAVVLRSTDGGNTFTERGRNFLGGYSAYISLVDAAQPDTVYVRSDLPSGGSMLLRSDDGGMTYRELVRTPSRILGVGATPDASRLWIGSSNPCEGIQRSSDGGRTWRTVNRQYSTLCMRYHANQLFICGDPVADGFLVAASSDDGETFAPVLRASEVRGPEGCAAGTGVRDRCTATWPGVMATIRSDAGVSPPVCSDDAATPGDDASADASAMDARVRDAGPQGDAGIDGPRDTGPTPPRTVTGSGCAACAIGSRPAAGSARAWVAAVLAAAGVVIGRRRRR